MLKFVLLATAMTFAAPALAQTTTTGQTTSAGRTSMSGTATTTADPAQATTPAQSAAPATPASDPTMTGSQPTAQTTPASPQTTGTATATTAQPAASGSQVAQVVDTEFPTYDKDKNGALSETEFGSWMVALKTASDPATKAESAETKAWVAGAFAQADKDKSKTVTKAELTGFLSQGKS